MLGIVQVSPYLTGQCRIGMSWLAVLTLESYRSAMGLWGTGILWYSVVDFDVPRDTIL